MSKNVKTKVELEIGLEGRFESVVPQEWTLAHMDPNWPAVFTTPAMIGMMEMASSYAVRPALPEGSITVGVRIEVDHLDRKSTRLNSSHLKLSRMPSSA